MRPENTLCLVRDYNKLTHLVKSFGEDRHCQAGKHVSLLVVPSSNFYEAAVRTAAQLESSDVVAGPSRLITSEEQAQRFNAAWDELETKPSQSVMFTVVRADGGTESFSLGTSSPDLCTLKFPTRPQPLT